MIRRALTRIFVAVLLAFCAYSAWQAHQLRLQVETLQSVNRLLLRHDRKAAPVPRIRTDRSLLESANAHIASAEDDLSHADLAGAQRELTFGGEDVRRAAQEPEAKTQAAVIAGRTRLLHLEQHLRTVQAQAQALSSRAAPQTHALRAQAARLQAQAHALWRTGRP